MKLFKLSLLSLSLMFSFALSHVVRAEDTSPAPVAKSVMTAMVNIENARLISQDKNTFTIHFSLTNGTGIQTGVKYGVQLIKDGTSYVADEKVYTESLSLAENSKEEKEVVYTAPSQLSGNYTLYVAASNESSFPFAIAPVEKVKLTATTKGISIDPASCYLQVEGEKEGTHYSLSSGVDISKDESLRLTCTAVNGSDASITVNPFFETRFFGSYGAIITPQDGGQYASITFTKNQKKTFSTLLPKGINPQFYGLKVMLTNATTTSNAIYARYIIRGVTATVQKVSLDKNSYKVNEKGTISILWLASQGNFTRNSIPATALPKLSVKAVIKGDHDRSCITAIDQPLVRDATNPATVIPFTTKATCVNPTVTVTISDENGTALDTKDFTFTSTGIMPDADKGEAGSSIYIILGIVVVLILVGVGVSMRKKKTISNDALK